MSRSPSRLLPTLLPPTLALMALLALSPCLAAAIPLEQPGLSAVERPEVPGVFAKLWSVLSAVLATGSILDPNGTSGATGPGSDPDNGSVGNTGSGLDPNG